MTPEQLDKAKQAEAARRALPARDAESVFRHYRQLTIDNWTPPDPISPRVRAAREYLKTTTTLPGPDIDAGKVDYRFDAKAFLAGFAAAVKLAEPVVKALSRIAAVHTDATSLPPTIQTYRQSIGDGE